MKENGSYGILDFVPIYERERGVTSNLYSILVPYDDLWVSALAFLFSHSIFLLGMKPIDEPCSVGHDWKGNILRIGNGGLSMVEEKYQKAPEKVVLTRLLRLNAKIQGIITGLVLGLAIFFATEWLVLKGGKIVGPHLSLLSQFFIGYRVTFFGGTIGFAYEFVIGFLIGYFIAKMYNWLVDLKEEKGPQHG